MRYLSPVINEVHNKLNTHLTIKLNYVRYSIPANETTRLDFDMMSRASGSEREDLFGAISEGYIAVDILILKDGKYEKVGTYEATKEEPKVFTRPVVNEAPKAQEMAKKLGITVKDAEVKKESVNKVETAEKPALDPIKAINNPKMRKSAETAVKKETLAKAEEPKTALDSVKENTEKDK